MTDENRVIVQAASNGAATVYHDVDGDEPKCNTPIRLGNWQVVSLDEAQADFDKCQKCSGGVRQCPEENESILYRARHGSPEDFGLEQIPERRKWSDINND